MNKIQLFLITTLFNAFTLSFGQTTDSLQYKHYKLSGFPVAFYSPETKLAFGGLGIIAFKSRKYPQQRYPSQVQIGAAYTINKQLLFYLPFRIYFNKDRITSYGETGYYKYSYFFYGIGNNQPAAYQELYKVNYPRVRLNVLYRINSKLYAGLRYWFENYHIVETEAGQQLATDSTITGNRGGITAGVGPVINFDTRDNLFYPSKGWFIDMAFQSNAGFTGSDFRYNRISVDAAVYVPLKNKSVIAFNIFTDFVNGEAPFNQLALLGGNKKMRGYYEGRYRDKKLIATGAEYRFTIYRRFGATLFVNAGAVNNSIRNIHSFVHSSYGTGLRYRINTKDKINIRVDAAFGQHSSGYYFTIGEAF